VSARRRTLAVCLALSLVPLAGGATPEEDVRFAAQDAERYLARTGLVVEDPAATAYLQGILGKIVAASPHESLADCRAFLLRGTRASAFALPQCRLYLSVALFMALDNEAQIAAVMAREIAHVPAGSVVRNRRTLEKRLNGAVFMSSLAAALGGFPGGVGRAAATDAVEDLIWRVSVRGFTQDIELQADRDGLARLRATGFTDADALRALERLRHTAPMPGEQRDESLPLLASRAVLDARIERLRMAMRDGSEGAAPADPGHAALVQGLRLEQVKEFVRAGEQVSARHLLAELVAGSGPSGMTHFLSGELDRLNGAGSRESALAAYEAGATFPDAPAELFLNLGLIRRELGEHRLARQAFARFLELEPRSAQADLVRYYLSKPVEGT
jgi:predicted Zn-dependent protease